MSDTRPVPPVSFPDERRQNQPQQHQQNNQNNGQNQQKHNQQFQQQGGSQNRPRQVNDNAVVYQLVCMYRLPGAAESYVYIPLDTYFYEDGRPVDRYRAPIALDQIQGYMWYTGDGGMMYAHRQRTPDQFTWLYDQTQAFSIGLENLLASYNGDADPKSNGKKSRGSKGAEKVITRYVTPRSFKAFMIVSAIINVILFIAVQAPR